MGVAYGNNSSTLDVFGTIKNRVNYLGAATGSTGNSNEVTDTTEAFQTTWRRAKIHNDLVLGTDQMRSEYNEYLPRYPQESTESYAARVKMAVLFNSYKKTFKSLTSKPFRTAMGFSDNLHEQLKPLRYDTDNMGNNAHTFFKGVFESGYGKGLTHVLIDMPNIYGNGQEPTEEELAQTRPYTLKDAEGVRPYMVNIQPENVISAFSEIINGSEVITHIRFLQVSTERVGFSEVEVRRIKVLEPGSYQIWREVTNTEEGSSEINGQFILEDQGVYSLDYVPLLTWYADKQAFMVGLSPLTDLAFKNIEHFQSSSDQRNILTVARFPMLAARGYDKDTDGPVVLGPRQFLSSTSKDTQFYYVEHTGASIMAGDKDLSNIKEEMAMMGMELMVNRGSRQSATSKSLDAVESASDLQAMVRTFESFIDLCFLVAADWLQIPTDDLEIGSMLNKDFGISSNDMNIFASLYEMYKDRQISRVSFFKELKRRGALEEEFNAAEDLLEINLENRPAIPDQTTLTLSEEVGTSDNTARPGANGGENNPTGT